MRVALCSRLSRARKDTHFRWRDVLIAVVSIFVVYVVLRTESSSQAAWDEALASERPVVYEALTDPEVPPLPPHITAQEAKMLARALAKGDPARTEIMLQAAKGKLQEFVNR